MARAPDVQKEHAVENLKKMLEGIVLDGTAPSNISPQVLASQGATYSLAGVSLNSAKRIANRVLVGGFSELDTLRLNAHEKLRTTAAKSRVVSRREHMQGRIDELEVQLDTLEQDLLHLTGAVDFALERMRTYAKKSSDPRAMEKLRDDEQELFARASLVVNREPRKKRPLHLVFIPRPK